MKILIEEYDCLDSTNDTLYKRGLDGAKEGLTILAATQKKGKGRAGRSFYSPRGNLYMSFLLRPFHSPSELGYLTPMVAVAVYNAVLEVFGISLGIKWVNDLYYGGKKVCGILTSLHLDERNLVDFAVVGIGINVYSNELPDELKDIVGFLLDVSEKKAENKIGMRFLAEKVCDHFIKLYEGHDILSMMEVYRDRSIVLGNKIKYLYGYEEREAIALDISNDGELVVRFDDGKIEYLSDGEVHILEMNGDV